MPWGLKLTDPPTATLFICDYPKTAFTGAYKEAAVLVHVKTPLGAGLHCCWMVVDDDTALILGREVLGYPKKLADIKYEESAGEVSASVTRRGVTVLSMVGRRGRTQNPAPPVFDFKTFNVSGPGQLYMVQPIWLFRPKEIIHESYQAEVEVTLRESAYDPIKPSGFRQSDQRPPHGHRHHWFTVQLSGGRHRPVLGNENLLDAVSLMGTGELS